jgi:hypothetical protein
MQHVLDRFLSVDTRQWLMALTLVHIKAHLPMTLLLQQT